LFRDGNIPKNKDQNKFLNQVNSNEDNRGEKVFKDRLKQDFIRRGFTDVDDLPEEHPFGIIEKREDIMKKLMTSGYCQNQLAVDALEAARVRKVNKVAKPPKPTNTAVMRG